MPSEELWPSSEGREREERQGDDDLEIRVDELFASAVDRQVAEQRQLNRLLEDLGAALHALRDEEHDVASRVEAISGTVTAALEQQDAALRRRIAELLEAGESQAGSLRESNAARIAALREAMREELARLRETVEAQRTATEAQLAALREEQEEQLLALRTSHQAALAGVRETVESELAALRREIDRLRGGAGGVGREV